ncbi:MAG: hypothetical protein RBR05_03550 [Candidatus Methanomethylophilaceae archaeon]|nr:hypothetical protein [Candidatus Methanomethylophilaceae archaeon]MDY0224459.1 hypothetical protein [Candidatus Methanomethylophilaceae archaeon]
MGIKKLDISFNIPKIPGIPNVPNAVSHIMTMIHADEKTKQDKLDEIIVNIFPIFIVACAILSIVLILIMNAYTFSEIIYGICLGYTIGFIILGALCMPLANKGVRSWKFTAPIVILIPAATACFLYIFGEEFDPSIYLIRFFDIFGGKVTLDALIVCVYSIAIMIVLVSYGVVAVIVGYFRSYFYRIIRSLEAPPEKRTNHIPEWLFQIPDIIDVKDIELEPDLDDDKFNRELFVNVTFSIFILGLVICSYIFLNPLFLKTMPFGEMLVIATLVSLFMSPLVIPWSIVKSIGAKVISDAPRPLYLWKGMKGRLYQGFFAIAFFMMLLMMSAYLGMDFSRIAVTYLGYIAFMGVISIVTAFVYVNYFYNGFKNGIIKSYYLSKYKNS